MSSVFITTFKLSVIGLCEFKNGPSLLRVFAICIEIK